MQKIDMNLWERKELFEFFSGVSQPFYSVTFTVEVTKLYDYVKSKGLSFYYALVYLCTEAVNETEAFLYVLREGELYRIDRMEQTSFIDGGQETDDLIYFSCLPWIELTALTNERDFCADDSVPRIAWGKYREENGRKRLQMSVELNHRFTDGVHVGMFYTALRGRIEALE